MHPWKWPYPEWIHFTRIWGTHRSRGRYWKRLCSKARRRAAKEEIKTELPARRYGKKYEDICDWKGW